MTKTNTDLISKAATALGAEASNGKITISSGLDVMTLHPIGGRLWFRVVSRGSPDGTEALRRAAARKLAVASIPWGYVAPGNDVVRSDHARSKRWIDDETVADAALTAERARAEAEHAEWQSRRAELLVGTYCVGADSYSSEYWADAKRPPIELSYRSHPSLLGGQSDLARLPNGDWIEYYGTAWCRHTYDVEYALDCERRERIAGYSLSARVVAALDAVCEVGADRGAGWSLFGGRRPRATEPAYSGMRNLDAHEYAEQKCQSLEELRERHPDHSELIDAAQSALREPEAVRTVEGAGGAS